jgi:hypothetical protein
MRRLIIIPVLFLTVLFSSPSYAKWTALATGSVGTFYVDVKRIRIVDGYVYIWELVDFINPNKWGERSVQNYKQIDCKLFRYKDLRQLQYKEPMGGGEIRNTINTPDKDWTYPPPSSVREYILKLTCRSVN